MAGWREELSEAVKSKAEREGEEQERLRKRVEEALSTAEAALKLGVESLRFARDKLAEKGQDVTLLEQGDLYVLSLGGLKLHLELVRDSALLKVTMGEAKPREFDFAKDRHIAAVDVEEYVGRRAVEVVRAAQKAAPW